MRIIPWVLLLVLATASGTFAEKAATTPDLNNGSAEFYDPFATPESEPLEDPLESLNRAFFRLNDLIYSNILGPFCRRISPQLHEKLIAFFTALDTPLRIGNFDLQFAFRDGGSEAGRLIMHTALDLLHHFDPAATEGLQNGKENFGQILQSLGFDPGIYLVLPVFGPSSMRDGIGLVTSFYLDPPPGPCNPGFRRAMAKEGSMPGALEKAGSLPEALEAYEEIRRQTLDPYLFLRDAYSQQLASAERNTHPTRTAASTPPEKKNVRHAALL